MLASYVARGAVVKRGCFHSLLNVYLGRNEIALILHLRFSNYSMLGAKPF